MHVISPYGRSETWLQRSNYSVHFTHTQSGKRAKATFIWGSFVWLRIRNICVLFERILIGI